MKPGKLERGDIVQLAPDCGNAMFACCFMTVTEPKAWGCQGFVQSLGEHGKPGGQAYYRAKWDEMEWTGGKAEWEVP